MEIVVNYDNVYCFSCRRKMTEIVAHHAYTCECRTISTDPITMLEVEYGWERCEECDADGCERCAFVGAVLLEHEAQAQEEHPEA